MEEVNLKSEIIEEFSVTLEEQGHYEPSSTELSGKSSRADEQTGSKAEVNRCNLCSKTFNKATILKKHKFQAHGIGKTDFLQCQKCPEAFCNPARLVRHAYEAHGSRIDITRVQEHQRRMKIIVKPSSLPHVCPACKQRFSTTAKREQHKVKCGKFPCMFCYDLINPAAIIVHEEMVHRVKRITKGDYTCGVCEAFLVKKDQAMRTEKLHWTRTIKNHVHRCLRSQPNECSTCKKRFKDWNLFKAHEGMCFADFKKVKMEPAENLNVATKPSYSDVSQQEILSCLDERQSRPITMPEPDNMLRDLLASNDVESICLDETGPLQPHSAQDDRRIQCGYCHAKFNFKASLLKHEVEDHGAKDQRLFQCEKCSERFYEKRYLENHIFKKHAVPAAREGDYLKCDMCEKAYLVKSESFFRRHVVKVHGASSLLKCGACPKLTFPNQFTLLRHMKSHENVVPERV